MRVADSSLFYRIAGDVRVRDVQRTFAFVWDIDRDGNDEQELLRRYMSEVGAFVASPVLLTADYDVENAGIRGAPGLPFGVWFPERVFEEAINEEGRLDESLISNLNDGHSLDGGAAVGTIEFPPSSFIAADAPLTSLFDRSCNLSGPRLVCDGTKWTGVVTSRELLSPPGRLCLLAMALEFEEAATELCARFPTQCLGALSKERSKKAVDLFVQKRGPLDDPDKARRVLPALNRRLRVADGNLGDKVLGALSALLIDCTTFIDKLTMLSKCKLLIDVSNTELRSVFSRIERIRNQCAHPVADVHDLELSLDELRDTLQKRDRILKSIREANERELGVRGRDNGERTFDR